MRYKYRGNRAKGEAHDFFLRMKKFAEKFYKSKAWQKCRAVVWARDKGLCVDCLKRGIIQPAEEVHHVIELTPENIDRADITLNTENLVSLCRECHQARHGDGYVPRYRIDPMGRVEIR